MKDANEDYLWDGTGEPDPDVQALEALLGTYRGARPAPDVPIAAPPRRFSQRTFRAVAAVLAVGLAGGVWASMLIRTMPNAPNPSAATPGPEIEITSPVPNTPKPVERVDGPGMSSNPGTNAFPDAPASRPTTVARHTNDSPRIVRASATPAAAELAVEPKAAPALAVDFETARHLERTELFLRSFRNAEIRDGAVPDLGYDRERSRELITRNALLRRSAERSKNLPVANVLDSVEPVLLDIANLGDKPSPAAVRDIQDRIERREIVTDLQMYSSLGARGGF